MCLPSLVTLTSNTHIIVCCACVDQVICLVIFDEMTLYYIIHYSHSNLRNEYEYINYY